MKKQIILGWMLLVSTLVFAQQEAQYTQYMYNTVTINPAYAGTRGGLSIFLLNRSQWVGLDGAPITSNLSIHSPLSKSLGFGVSVINDRIGPSDENTISADFSYSIKASENYTLSFGLKASGNLLNVNFNKLNIYDEDDYSFEDNITNRFSPNFGVGLYLFSTNSYIGVSMPNLLETKHFDKYANVGEQSYIARRKIHYYFIAGKIFTLNSQIKFKPAVLAKIVNGSPFQFDISGNFLINDKFTLGAAYRWDTAFSALLGIQAGKQWFIGYSYDFETTKLAIYNSGSHEVFLRYEIFKPAIEGEIISPRFF